MLLCKKFNVNAILLITIYYKLLLPIFYKLFYYFYNCDSYLQEIAFYMLNNNNNNNVAVI